MVGNIKRRLELLEINNRVVQRIIIIPLSGAAETQEAAIKRHFSEQQPPDTELMVFIQKQF